LSYKSTSLCLNPLLKFGTLSPGMAWLLTVETSQHRSALLLESTAVPPNIPPLVSSVLVRHYCKSSRAVSIRWTNNALGASSGLRVPLKQYC
jgi:hypothetical protein